MIQSSFPPHILLVDDDPAIRQVLACMFRSFGYQVEEEESGEKAIGALARNSFDVVVTDLAMPGMNGLDLVRHVSTHHPETCAVIITGFADLTTFPQVYDAGAVDFIAKPVEREELQARIEWVLHQREIRRQLHETLEGHREAQDSARRSLATVSILNQLLHLAVEQRPLDEILDLFIVNITSLPWLGLQPKGAILLAGDDPPGSLVLKAHRNIAPELMSICSVVRSGRCLCGLTAKTRQVVFTNHLDERHHNTFPGITDHGHYCIPILAPGGELLGVFTLYVAPGTPYDVKVEDTLKAAAATMAGIILQHRSEEERNRLREELRQAQKLQALSTMASGFTHEIKNILTAIRGFASLIKEDAGEAQAGQDAAQILAVVDRGVEVVRKLQTASRADASRHVPVRVTPVVREGLGGLRQNLPPGISLREHYETAEDTVMGDAGDLHEVVSALVSNACKATRRQGGTISVLLETVDLKRKHAGATGLLTPGHWLRLTVSDTGIGMTPEVMARIFEPYFSGSSHEDGAGLGLTVVLGIVKAMEGDIIVDSTFGRGTSVAVYLPPLPSSEPPKGTTP